jgi:putative membrane protein
MSGQAQLGAIAVMLAVAVPAHAHEGQRGPGAWTVNPWLIGLLCAAVLAYLRGDRLRARKRSSDRGPHSLERSAFFAALVTLALALLSPLDRLSDLSFAAHMTQHELLMLVAAPLLVLARPLPTYLHAWPERWRPQAAELLRNPHAVRVFRVATAPLLALFVHGAVRWVWHLQGLFEAAMADEWIHGVQHASFFLSALLFWWGLLQGRAGRAGYGLAALFVLITAMHTGALGALLSLSDRVWYPTYAARAGLVELEPLHDQQLAGLIMWVGAFVWLLMLALALLFAWLGEARRRAARGTVALVTRQEAP